MTGSDTGSLLLLALALGAIVVVAGILFDWRGLMARGGELPLWSFLRLQGVARESVAEQVGERGLRVAEMRCAACGSQQECLHRVATGNAAPVADCPNAALFGQASGLTKESRSDGLKPAA